MQRVTALTVMANQLIFKTPGKEWSRRSHSDCARECFSIRESLCADSSVNRPGSGPTSMRGPGIDASMALEKIGLGQGLRPVSTPFPAIFCPFPTQITARHPALTPRR